MILAENKNGHQLLEYIQVSEKDLVQSDIGYFDEVDKKMLQLCVK